MTEDRLFAEAVEWACPFVRNAVLRRRAQTPQDHAAAIMPNDDSDSEILHFELTVNALVTRAATGSFAFDVLKNIAAACLRSGRQMPPIFVAFAAEILDGTRCRPTRRGPQPGRNGELDRVALGSLVRIVATKFGLAEYSNNNDRALTAAWVVVKALARENHGLSHDAVVKARQRLGELIS